MSNSTTSTNKLTVISFGNSIVIVLAFLVLLSTLFLASYLCFRFRPRSSSSQNSSLNPDSDNGVILPRTIFVTEDDDNNPQNHDENAVVGLDQNVINSYPRFSYTKDLVTKETICSICLCEFKDSEILRMMPECRHYFHLYCLDAWLKLNGSCPVCQNSPLPTPLSTPLQEVVPLSQSSADRRRRR